MILTAALMHGLGMHLGAWMARDGAATDFLTPEFYADIARTAEAGKLHALFLAEITSNQEHGVAQPSGSLDAISVLSFMAAHTSRIGLVGTASTTYNEPYEVARRFATLDHLSRGRVAWNSVATHVPQVAAQFGGAAHPDHEDRYARAGEFLDVVGQLWDSWDADAVVADTANGTFARADRVHEINHVGRFFSVKGPLPFPRPPQGRPPMFQAGASALGRDLAAKYADCVFTAQHLMEDAIAFRADLRRRAQTFGRSPDSIKILPGIALILGETEEKAWARKTHLEEMLGLGPQLAKLGRRIGIAVEDMDLDKPLDQSRIVPEEKFAGSIGFRRSILNFARAENLTVRELALRYGGGHHELVGTPQQIADHMQRWMQSGAADGFTLMVDMLPSGLHQAVDMLVPELQRRGLLHRDYEHAMLRDNLGLGAPRVARAA